MNNREVDVTPYRRREKIGPSAKLARQVLHRRKSQAAEERFFPERAVREKTFGDLAEKFWKLHGTAMKSPSWRSMLKKILAAFGPRRVAQIRPGDLQEFYNRLRDEYCVATANRHLTLIKSIFNRSIEWGDHPWGNPASKVKTGRENNSRLRFLSEEEIGRLLRACSHRIRPIVTAALMTGMRKGELLRLDWRDVNLPAGVLVVRESKSGRPREIPIAPKLAAVLRGLGPAASGPVFGVPEITLRRNFRKALAQAGIEDFRFHDCRHTFASHFIMRTAGLPALQRILGHRLS